MKKTLLKTTDPAHHLRHEWRLGKDYHVVDLQGFNYNIVQYDPFRAKHPRMPMFGSETASTV